MLLRSKNTGQTSREDLPGRKDEDQQAEERDQSRIEFAATFPRGINRCHGVTGQGCVTASGFSVGGTMPSSTFDGENSR
jgi:hypothetical protein